jgi:hypothetical protein
MLVIAAVGGSLALGAPAAHAFGVANNCTTPTDGSGTTLSPNQPCWVAGVYNNDYTGMNDIQYIGPPAQVSGGHPFTGVTDFTVSGASPAVSTVRVDIPPGLVSNPLATPKCTDGQLTSQSCPNNTQLGIVRLQASLAGLPVFAVEDVYNMPLESSFCPNTAAVQYVSDYSFYVKTTNQRVDICGSVNRQPPYQLFFTISIPPGAATISSTLIFWGMPGDTGHDPQRGQNCLNIGGPCSIPASGPSHPAGTAFITNPTACLPSGQVSTLTLGAADGSQAVAQSKTPVPAINCSSLPFSPKLKLQLKGANQTKAGKHPTVIANLTQSLGQANIGLSKVTLPLSLALDPINAQHVCSPTAAFNDACPAKTVIGSARATTPLLSQPLTGKVYLVQGIACTTHVQPSLLGVCPSGQPFHTEPALLVALRGQSMIDLHAQTSVSKSKKLVTTFFDLPDLPETSFQLKINGGKRGIIVVTGNKNLCSLGKQIAPTVFTGKNGATQNRQLKIATPCKK